LVGRDERLAVASLSCARRATDSERQTTEGGQQAAGSKLVTIASTPPVIDVWQLVTAPTRGQSVMPTRLICSPELDGEGLG
jgi:hypothetical protein